jgi:hypothetical protein
MIHEWITDFGNRNFGDAFTELLADILPFATKSEMQESTDKKYFLIGSVIDNEIIMNTLLQGYTPIFINCGWRGKLLSKILVDQCVFIGSRGPITQKALHDIGIEVDVTLDSAYLLKDTLDFDRTKNDMNLIFPHILSSEGRDSLTVVESREDVLEKIKLIANANFVLGGAMHSCIVAHMYGVPFAPYVADDFYVDSHMKWKDWLESVGIPQENLRFSRTLEEGVSWYKNNKQYLIKV